ncbi:MAG: bifunctional hydroxymethylpyrimidine kinase/phosphomethylpyrimidine kinase [Thermodesulfobacteriota bacterium]
MKTALTIAGSDPSGGAGVQADVLTFRALGVRGLSAVTAITVQNRLEVREMQVVPPRLLAAQVEALLDEFTVDAVKIGMLGSAANARAVAGLIDGGGLPKVVLDPVMVSSSGFELLGRGGVGAIRGLVARTALITPNIPEAAALAGIEITGVEGMEEAARAILAMGAGAVLVTGGHIEGPPVDVLYDGGEFTRLRSRRVGGGRERLHGTGCLLSAGAAAGLARGLAVAGAVSEAKRYVEETLRKRR